jgi:hypothetical protein
MLFHVTDTSNDHCYIVHAPTWERGVIALARHKNIIPVDDLDKLSFEQIAELEEWEVTLEVVEIADPCVVGEYDTDPESAANNSEDAIEHRGCAIGKVAGPPLRE